MTNKIRNVSNFVEKDFRLQAVDFGSKSLFAMGIKSLMCRGDLTCFLPSSVFRSMYDEGSILIQKAPSLYISQISSLILRSVITSILKKPEDTYLASRGILMLIKLLSNEGDTVRMGIPATATVIKLFFLSSTSEAPKFRESSLSPTRLYSLTGIKKLTLFLEPYSTDSSG